MAEDADYCYICSVICQCVCQCLLVASVSPAKTDEPIEMLFGCRLVVHKEPCIR